MNGIPVRSAISSMTAAANPEGALIPSHGSPAQRQFLQLRQDLLEPLDPLSHLGSPPAELLAEGDRRGVHEMGPTRFHDVIELGGLGLASRRT